MHYKFLIFLLTLALATTRAYPQYHVSYTFTYLSDGEDTVNPVLGRDKVYQDYYIMNGRYKSFFDSGDTWMEMYDSEKNIRYVINTSGEIVEYDAGQKTGDVKEIIRSDSLINILGYPCKRITFKYEKVSTTYYYSDELKIDRMSYANHLYGDWNQVVREMNGSIPLKFVTEYKTGGYEAVATQIEELEFSKDDFKPKKVLNKLRQYNKVKFQDLLDAIELKYGALQRLKTVSAIGKMSKNKISIPFRLYIKQPSAVYMDMSVMGTSFIVSNDGKETWQYDPLNDLVTIDPVPEERSNEDAIGEFSPMTNNTWKDYTVISFRDYKNQYRITIQGKEKQELFFINKDNLLVESKSNSENKTFFENYTTISGIPFPKKLEQFQHNQDAPMMSMEFEKVEFDLAVPDSIFRIPDSLKSRVEAKVEIKSAKTYFDEAEELSKDGKYAEAMDLYKKAISLSPDYALYYNQLGMVLLRSDDNYGAITAFSQAVNVDSEYHKSWYNLGYTKMKIGDYKAAIADFTQAVELNPADPTYHNYKGLCYYNLQNYDTALLSFQKVIELDSSYRTGYWNVAMSNYQKSNFEQALPNFTSSIKVGYSSPSLYNYRGICHYQLSQYELALKDFLEATKSDEPEVDYYQNLGNSYSQLNNSKLAIESYSEAIKLDSTFAEAYNLIGLEFYNEGSYGAAISYFTDAIKFGKNEAVYFDNRGQAKNQIMDYLGAIDDFSRSISLYPDDANIYYLRGLAKKNIDNKFDACSDFKRASELGDEQAKETLSSYCQTE